MVGSYRTKDRTLLSSGLELLSASLAERQLPLDIAGAESASVTATVELAKSSGLVVVIVGAIDALEYAACLGDIPELDVGRTDLDVAPNVYKLRGDIAYAWDVLLPAFATRSVAPILILALSLEDGEVAFLRSQMAGRNDLWGTTVLGERAADELHLSEFTRTWLLWTRRLPPDLPARVTASYRNRLGIPDSLLVESRSPLMARVEVVSLRTAAQASGGRYGHLDRADAIYDMHGRLYKPDPRPFEFAVFSEAVVLSSSSWKVLVDGRLYVEEVGYVEHQRPHLVESWPEFGARWTIRAAGPAFEIPGDHRFTLLLGGDVAHYHLILNWLPRLMALEDCDLASLLGDTPRIAVSSRFSDKEKQLVRLLAKREVEFVMVPEAGAYRFTNLIVPSFFSHHELTPAVADWYRRRLGVRPSDNPRRIYISRADARAVGTPRRKVVNEAEVIAVLSLYGFEPVALGALAMEDQISLFANAEFVIGPHGAGFANMVFTPAGARAIILENSWAHDFISDMLNVSGHRSSILICSDHFSEDYEAQLRSLGLPDTEIHRSRDMIVDCQALTELVKARAS